MLTVLAGQWPVLLLRAVIAILFGVLALVWPGLTLGALIILFGAYALVDGIAALVMAVASRGLQGFGSLFFIVQLVLALRMRQLAQEMAHV